MIPHGIKNWHALAWVFARASLATLFSLFSLHALLDLCLLKYCTISFNSAPSVTHYQLAEISISAGLIFERDIQICLAGRVEILCEKAENCPFSIELYQLLT